ncbi:MAG: dihydroorotase [Ruminococcaceae bacterium]|nr:dihydroorotase [Oscillospiraceae bacterium]
MERYIFLQNARIAETSSSRFRDSDILIRTRTENAPSEIVAIGDNIDLPSGPNVMIRTFNLNGQIVCPSFVDMRCDICEPGNRYREDLSTLGKAASSGGFGAIVSIPIVEIDAAPETVIAYILENEIRTNGVKILPSAPVTQRNSPQKTVDFDKLTACGAAAFGDDGSAETASMLEAMRSCANKDYLFILHCEEKSLTKDRVMNEGSVSSMLGLGGIPSCAEEIAVAKNILLASQTGCRIHISHISTAKSAEIIRQAKKAGVRVTCDTAPQYFTLSENDIIFYSENAKVMPPLRTSADISAIIEAIRDGTIDCICSDHTPRTESEKPHDLSSALSGITGLQTAFTLALDRLVMDEHIDIFRLISMFTDVPAKIIGVGYDIAVGQRAYLNVISLDYDTIFQSKNVKSKSKNTPFLDTNFRGCLTYTITDGVISENPDKCIW